MTEPTTDLRDERLARDLRAAAREIHLTPGSELAVVTRGRRRRHRQRRATTFTLVTALAAGTALGVQQLSRNGDDSIASEQVDETVPTISTDPSTPGSTAPASPTPTAPPVATAAPQAAPDHADIPDDVPPAQLTEPTLEWTVVEPDSTQAVAYATFGYGGVVEVPGVVLATAPGRSDDFQPMLWQTDDGITWTPLDVDVPVGQPQQLSVDGGSLYLVGTAPGIAKTDPNPLVVASSADGVTWDQIELPVDVNADRDLPFIAGVSAYGTATPYDGGVFVLTQRSVGLDFDEVARENDAFDPARLWEYRVDGVTVTTEDSCPSGVVPTTIVSDAMLMPLDQPPSTVPGGGCETEFLAWADLGLPAETVAALAAPQSRGFRVVDGEVTEIQIPEGLSPTGYAGDDGPTFTDLDGNWYRLDEGGELAGIDPPAGVVSALGWPIGSAGDTTFTSVQTSSSFYGVTRDLVVADGPSGRVWTDYSDLHGDGVISSPTLTGVTPAGLVRAVATYTDLIAARGGVEETGDGLTVRRTSLRDDPEFFVTDSGEQIDVADMRQDTLNGDLVAVDETGDEIARMSGEVASRVLYGAYPEVQQTSWYIETTVDGQHVAVESVASLLGVDDSDISGITRISTDGTRTIVAVTMRERNAEGVPRQLVLVGTPKG